MTKLPTGRFVSARIRKNRNGTLDVILPGAKRRNPKKRKPARKKKAAAKKRKPATKKRNTKAQRSAHKRARTIARWKKEGRSRNPRR